MKPMNFSKSENARFLVFWVLEQFLGFKIIPYSFGKELTRAQNFCQSKKRRQFEKYIFLNLDEPCIFQGVWFKGVYSVFFFLIFSFFKKNLWEKNRIDHLFGGTYLVGVPSFADSAYSLPIKLPLRPNITQDRD